MVDRPQSTESPAPRSGSWHVPDRPAAPRRDGDARRTDVQDLGDAPSTTAQAVQRRGSSSAGLEQRPAAPGGWHRPTEGAIGGGFRRLQPEAAPAEIEPAPAADDEPEPLPIDDAPAASAEPAADAAPVLEPDADILPHDDEFIPAEADAETDAPPPDVIPFDDDAGLSGLADLAASVTGADAGADADAANADAAVSADADAADSDDAGDDASTFSMSELIALASLAESEAQPARAVAPPAAVTAAPAATTPGTETPADYARRQLEALGGGQPVMADAGVADARIAVTPDSAPTVAEPAAPAVVLSPAEQALADRFRTAEGEVRALRDQFRAGTLSREDFQAAARQKMVLDEANTYWMLGVESDNWYHYVNGQWVQETPPVLAKAAAASAGASAAPAIAPVSPTGPTISGGDEMPLPRAVPVRDPDLTQAGTAAVFVPTTPGIPAATGTSFTPLTGAVPTADTDGDLDATLPVRTLGTDPAAADDPYRTVVSAPISEQDTLLGRTVPSGVLNEATIPNPAISVPSPVAPDVATPPDYNVNIPSQVFEEAQKRQQTSTLRNLLIAAAVLIGACALVTAVGLFGAVAWYNNILEPWRDDIAALASYQPQFQTARIYAADGSLIAELVSQNAGARTVVPLENISPFLIHAVVATENERYYEDPGFDPIAIARAMIQNLTAGEIESGASTITQQVARNLVLRDSSITAERKLQEIVIASAIAQQFDKNFILELYLNETFFGNQSYGVEAAAEFYFSNTAQDLDIAQSAMLAGLIQAPAAYDPVINREASFARMNVVLDRMARTGCLQFQHAPYLNTPFCVSPGDLTTGSTVLAKAQVEARNYTPRTYTVEYPHFVNYIQAQIEQNFGTAEMFQRGFNIYTTLIPRVQDTAQTSLTQQVNAAAGLGVNTGAVLVSDPATGAIWAMVGSPDFNNIEIDGQVNNVFTWQQPGSSIKLVEYTAALEGVSVNGFQQYMTPATVLWDVPTTWNTVPPYSPTNFNGRFNGPVTLRTALASSLNIPAVKVYEFIGADRFIDTAQRLGLRFLETAQFGLSTALGADDVRLYDHVQAYSTIANNGVRVPLYAITRITDAGGRDIPVPQRPQPSQTIQPQIAFLMQNILSDNDSRQLGFGINNGLTLPEYPNLVAAKTGTSNDNRDLWTMGFTRNVVVGVWIGRHDNGPTRAGTDSTAIPVWNAVMRAALAGTTPAPFQPPQGIAQAQVCADTGTLFDAALNPRCSQVRTEIFVQTQPPPTADQGFVVNNVPVDSWTGLRANQYCQDNVVNGTAVTIADPSAVAWLSSPAGAGTAQRLGIPVPVPASLGECQPGQQLPVALITSPAAGQPVQGTVAVTGTITAGDFNRYQLELAPANTESWALIAGPFGGQVTNGQLATFDSTRVPNGEYRLRLAAFSNTGGFVYRIVNVVVSNPTPTPSPTPLPPTPTPFFPTGIPVLPTAGFPPPAGFTPIPFDTPIPLQPLGVDPLLPTPTVDMSG